MRGKALIPALLCCVAFAVHAWAGLDVPPSVDVNAIVQQAISAAPVKSVTGQTGNVALPTPCGNASIPSANTVSNTASETVFGSTCVIKANTFVAGNAVHLHVGGVYSAGVAQSATGRVRFTQSGTPNLTSDTTIISTGSVGGLANSTNQEWWGDVWITFQTGSTAIDVQGLLFFQTGANASVSVPIGNVNTFTVDPTKDLTLYVTVQWGAAMTMNSMTLRTMAAK